MKSIMIVFLMVLQVNVTMAQSLAKGETHITKMDIREFVSEEEYLILKIKDILEKHAFLNQIEITKKTELTDWVKFYNLAFPDDELNKELISPGMRRYQEISDRHRNNIVLTTIAQTIKLPRETDLQTLLQKLQSNQIDLDKAEEELEEINSIDRNVFVAATIKPLQSFDAEINILVPVDYQFISDKFTIASNNLIGEKIRFNTGTGENEIQVLLQEEGKTVSQITTDLYDDKTAEKYRNRKFNTHQVRTEECNEPYIRNFETILETGLDCTGGCDEETPFLMQGEALIVEGNDCELDRIMMITDGIDYFGRSAEEILESLGGVETFRYLLDHGIDIMIVDWPSQMGWIENNSAYFQDMVRELTAEEHFESIEMLVGISMGGPITRHALLSMEENGEEHFVKNWVAGDSPLEGSNVSIGTQALAKEMILNGNEVSEEVLQALMLFNQILDSPAAREMLRYHLSLPEDYVYIEPVQFINKLLVGNTLINPQPDGDFELYKHDFDEYGYPTQTVNNIAIADGSGIGLLLSSPGTQIFNAAVDGPNSYIKGFASDGLGDLIVMKKKYHWILPVRYTKLNYGIDNIDGAPGSKFPLQDFDIDGLIWDSTWSFASTTSALGITGDPQNVDLSESPFITNSSNPWENIFVTDENEIHSDFSSGYGDQKLEFLIGRLDPSLFDPSNFIVANQALQFHFENKWGVPINEFCIGDDVFIDGSLTTNQMNGFQLTLFNANTNQELAHTDVLPGSPTLVNITEEILHADPGFVFLPIDYRLQVEIFSTACGAELVKSHVFNYRECCTANPFYPPSGPSNIWIEDGQFHWDPVGGATQYRIDFGFPPGYDGPVPLCNCGLSGDYPTIYGIEGTSYPIPEELINSCFYWSVRAYCPEIGWSQPSGIDCYDSEFSYRSTDSNTFEIFPNPANEHLSVRFDHVDMMDFEVYDSQGKLVLFATGLKRADVLDISQLPVGIYMLKDPDNLVAPVRFVKD